MGKRHIPRSSNLADYLIQRSRVGGFVTTAIISFTCLQFLTQGDPRCFSRSFNPVFNPMWRTGISIRWVHLCSSVYHCPSDSFQLHLCSGISSGGAVTSQSLRSSVLVDWQALVQHLVPRSRCTHSSIAVELADLFSVASIQIPSGVFHIWRHNDIFPIAGLGTYIAGVGIHLHRLVSS